jgi:hypothetical protein
MINQQTLHATLMYDPETGIFTNRFTRHYKSVEGDVAGAIDALGYVIIKLFGESYKAHRLAFLYMEGSFPEEDTDHINRIRSDNRWVNLRRASTSQNLMNRPVFSNNKTGFTGVFKRENGKFRVYVDADGSRTNGGTFTNYEDAVACRDELAGRLHAEFKATQ